MNFIYVSNTCSAQKYTEYIESKGLRVSQQAQKYNLLLAEGLAECGSDVSLLSSRPINRSVYKKIWFKGEKETAKGIKFSYLPFMNFPLLRNLFIFFGVFFRILFSPKKRKNTAVICDALNICASMAALSASALRGYKTVGIVTDVPCHLSDMKNIPFSQRLNLYIIKKFKSYLLLTRHMSEIVNPKNRPCLVLEGHSDVNMSRVENLKEQKYDKKVCLYAGSLKRIYGIENLVEGFISAKIPESELHIYGNGDYSERLKELAEKYDSVKYFGIAPNSKIVTEELKATLLINPRPTNEEYTKYSFPSKNMEYMASGTPVLTTELPGMPSDHKPYVFLIKDESSEGIKAALQSVFQNTTEQLHSFGKMAKEYILKEKNNIAQAGKVVEFLKSSLAVEEK